ncbi:unnamed protein product [Heterobilharzia americana]|nr:unnamed protein product [Heterobilharzia americana]
MLKVPISLYYNQHPHFDQQFPPVQCIAPQLRSGPSVNYMPPKLSFSRNLNPSEYHLPYGPEMVEDGGLSDHTTCVAISVYHPWSFKMMSSKLSDVGDVNSTIDLKKSCPCWKFHPQSLKPESCF